MKHLTLYEGFKLKKLVNDFNPDDHIYYMFDVPDPWYNNVYVMLSSTFQRFDEIRPLFYKTDLSKLEDFSVIINIHSEGSLGTYIVHNDWVEEPFIKSDDFSVSFTIKDYNNMKKSKSLTKDYDFFEQLERFKNDKYVNYDWYKNKDNTNYMNLKTVWTIVTYEDNPIALISEYDSWRLPNQMDVDESEEYKYNRFKVKSIEEGIEYIKL